MANKKISELDLTTSLVGTEDIPVVQDGATKRTTVSSLLSGKVDKEEGKGLFSGSYNDLTDKPEIDLSLYRLVDTLPTGSEINPDKVYLMKDAGQSTEDLDVYVQYKYIDSAWSTLGTYKTAIDLSGYVEKETGKGLFSGSYNDLTGKPDLSQYETLSHATSTYQAKGNYVTTDTDQTITASKTFSKDIILKAGSSNSQGSIRANGANELIISDGRAIYFRNTNTATSTTDHGFKVEYTNQNGVETNTLKPETNKGLSLGLSGYQWKNIYGETIYQGGKQVANKEDIKVVDVKVDGTSVVTGGTANIDSYDDTEVRGLINKKQDKLTGSQIVNTNDVTDDAARFLWGGDWRLPTYDEINALFGKIDSGQWSYTKDMSVQSGGTFSCGYARISGNSQSIVLPTTSRNGSTQDSDHFFYVSSTLNENNNKTYRSRATYHRDWKNDAKNFANDWYPNHDRYVGLAIRPVLDKGGNANGHTAVDIGLSVLWADRNLGAAEPKAVGSKFAWGEVKPKETYTWGNYKYYDAVNSTTDSVKLTRYVTNETYGIKDGLTKLTIASFYTKEESESRFSLKNHTHETYVEKETGKGLSTNDYDSTDKAKVDAIPEDPKYTDTVYDDTEVRGLIDKKQDKLTGSQIINTNDVTDDAARYNWGGGWRMPTYEELGELYNVMPTVKDNSWAFTDDTTIPSGGWHPGYVTIVSNGNSIVLPTQYARGEGQSSDTDKIIYMTSNLSENCNYYHTYQLYFLLYKSPIEKRCWEANVNRFKGSYIRPVLDRGADANGHATIDLGLSVLWADRNIGALNSKDLGDIFAWGEVKTKEERTLENYRYYDAVNSTTDHNKYTRYVTDETYGIKDGLAVLTSATFYTKEESDNRYALKTHTHDTYVEKETGKGLSSNDYNNSAKTKVDAIPGDPKYTDTIYDDTEVRSLIDKKQDKLTKSQIVNTNDVTDDAARYNWGGDWRMPTKAELDELFSKTFTFTEDASVGSSTAGRPGYAKVTGNGQTLIIPTTYQKGGPDSDFFNYCSGELRTDDNRRCYAWGAYAEIWNNSHVGQYEHWGARYDIFPVRAVLDKGGNANGHTAVDIGLSVLWADRNIGASEPKMTGLRFRWGEVEPTTDTEKSWEKYKYYDSENSVTHVDESTGKTVYDSVKLTRYVTDETYGIKDGLTRLTIASFYTKEESDREYALNKNTKALVIEYEDGTTETVNIVIKP